jgi:hypothetical protein
VAGTEELEVEENKAGGLPIAVDCGEATGGTAGTDEVMLDGTDEGADDNSG